MKTKSPQIFGIVFAVGCMVASQFASVSTYATSESEYNIPEAQAGIAEIIERYNTRSAFTIVHDKCALNEEWKNITNQAQEIQRIALLHYILLDGSTDTSIITLTSVLPESLRTEALAAPTLLDALEIIKSNDIYQTNSSVKKAVDNKIQEINQLLTAFEQVKQKLIAAYPEYATELANLKYTDVMLPWSYNGEPATKLCNVAKTLANFVADENYFEEGHGGVVYQITSNYRTLAVSALSFDKTILDGVNMPLIPVAERAWNLVHEARRLPSYDTFYDYFTYKINQEELLEVFYPNLNLEELRQDTMQSDEEDEYYEKVFELIQNIPYFDEYKTLVTNVRTIESATNGMNETSGAAMLSSNIDETYLPNLDLISESIDAIPAAQNEPADADADVPAAPDTGSKGSELASVIEKTITMVAVCIAVIAGAAVVVKLYMFSPLKRKK